MGGERWAAGSELRAAGSALRAPGCGLRTPSCGLRAPGCGLRAAATGQRVCGLLEQGLRAEGVLRRADARTGAKSVHDRLKAPSSGSTNNIPANAEAGALSLALDAGIPLSCTSLRYALRVSDLTAMPGTKLLRPAPRTLRGGNVPGALPLP